jgi:hypothetical protein
MSSILTVKTHRCPFLIFHLALLAGSLHLHVGGDSPNNGQLTRRSCGTGESDPQPAAPRIGASAAGLRAIETAIVRDCPLNPQPAEFPGVCRGKYTNNTNIDVHFTI